MADDKKIEVKKIVIKIGSKDIELTPEEAKKLHQALDEFYGKEVIVPSLPVVPYPVPYPMPVMPYTPGPIWYYNSPTVTWCGGTIECNSDTGTLNLGLK